MRDIMKIMKKIRHFLAHFFTPRESNNHRAKILHHTNILLTIVFFVLASFLIQGVKAKFPSVLGIKVDISSEQLLFLTNQERRNVGAGELVMDNRLSEAAERKAEDMFKYGYWAHNSPTGKTPWAFIKQAGYKYVYAGENLARGFSTPEDVVRAWMASPDHKANMLSTNYRDVGFAIKLGVLNGEETVLIVEEFGSTTIPIAKSPKIQEVSAAKDANEVQANIQIVKKEPLIDISSLTSNVYIAFIGVFIVVFFVDAIVIERKKVMRFVGHNIDHILYLLLIMILIGIWGKGVII